MKTHFGPEESEERMQRSAEASKQKREYLDRELKKQIEVILTVIIGKSERKSHERKP